MNDDVREIADEIEKAGYEPRAYSGRGMYGKQCLGVGLESDSDLWDLAWFMGSGGFDVGAPRTDSLGRGIIAYWPSLKWEDPRP